MKRTMSLIVFLCASVQGWGFQTDIVYPWVTNNANFQAILVINNLNDVPVDVTLTATRPSGFAVTETETIDMTLAPFEQIAKPAGELFIEMGAVPPGYAVRLTSEIANISGGFVVSATSTASGNSPSQANVVAAASAGPVILFDYLPIAAGSFAAPVIVNLGAAETEITYHAFQNGEQVDTAMRTVAAGRPYAEGVVTLFPDVVGDIYVAAAADQPLLGVAFIFNELGEPSMANAVTISQVPQPPMNNNGGTTVSFAGDLLPIIVDTCALETCHFAPMNSGDLNLEGDNAYLNIVNVPAVQDEALNLVTPGDPENSYLYRKLRGDGNFFGQRMPRSPVPPLSDPDIELFRVWILEGALDN